MISFHAQPELVAAVDWLAEWHGTSRAEALRVLLVESCEEALELVGVEHAGSREDCERLLDDLEPLPGWSL